MSSRPTARRAHADKPLATLPDTRLEFWGEREKETPLRLFMDFQRETYAQMDSFVEMFEQLKSTDAALDDYCDLLKSNVRSSKAKTEAVQAELDSLFPRIVSLEERLNKIINPPPSEYYGPRPAAYEDVERYPSKSYGPESGGYEDTERYPPAPPPEEYRDARQYRRYDDNDDGYTPQTRSRY